MKIKKKWSQRIPISGHGERKKKRTKKYERRNGNEI